MINYIEYIGSYKKAKEFYDFCKGFGGTTRYAKQINGEWSHITIDRIEFENQLMSYKGDKND